MIRDVMIKDVMEHVRTERKNWSNGRTDEAGLLSRLRNAVQTNGMKSYMCMDRSLLDRGPLTF